MGIHTKCNGVSCKRMNDSNNNSDNNNISKNKDLSEDGKYNDI